MRVFSLMTLLAALLLAFPAQSEERLQVVAGFSVLADMVRQVGGDAVVVDSLIAPGSDPHHFDPSAQDVRRVQAADLLVFNGGGIEGDLAARLPAMNIAGTVLWLQENAPMHDDHDDHDDHAHGHAPDHRHSGASGAADPHGWVTPQGGMEYARKIAQALSALRPERAALFAENLARLKRALDATDTEFRAALEAVPPQRRALLTAHDALGRLGAEYDVRILPLQNLSGAESASAQGVAAVIEQARAAGVTHYFEEAGHKVRLMPNVAAALGARPGGTLYLETLDAEAGIADYPALLRHNFRVIAAALGAPR